MSIDTTKINLYTKRLLLRALKFEDFDDFYEYNQMKDIAYNCGFESAESKEEAFEVMRNFIDDKNQLAIVLDQKLIGLIGFYDANLKDFNKLKDRKAIEFGFVLNRNYHRRGYMSEVLNCMINYIFTKTNYDIIEAGYFIGNEKSKNLQQKFNFKEIYRQKTKDRAKRERIAVISILKKEDYLNLL
ncbi:MAG: GNAT family N-acetyltransferase [Tissierellia bacterium]|nr:GNAT family N-acetyltransferase [Tissierellia bacterium]